MTQQFKDSLHYVSMDAMNRGMYVTIIFYVSYKGITRICGRTYDKCVLQSEHGYK